MKYLNLTKRFNPLHATVEDTITYDSLVFNGGEPHIRIRTTEKHKEDVTITLRVNEFNDMGLLAIAVDALRALSWVGSISLLLPYFPGARQDRRALRGEALTVKVYADIINEMKFKEVAVYDVHSDVALAVIDNVRHITNESFVTAVLDILQESSDDLRFVSPDAGASKKTTKLAAPNFEVIYCSKMRDEATGTLSKFQVGGDKLKDEPCLVIDDICDGGGTFIGLAKELRKKGAGKLYLAVSHGIFSKGFDELGGFYDKIFTTDSIGAIGYQGWVLNGIGKPIHEFVKEIELNHLI